MGVFVSSVLNKFSRVALVCGLAFAASSFLWAEGSAGEVDEVARPSTGGISVPSRPEPDPQESARTMVASYYGYSLEGSPTATGEPFEPEGYTAAHKSLPLGTELEVSYGGESVEVTVNDRGPYVAGRDIDLSLAAAREIGLVEPGSASVRVTEL
ncbi:MAG: septal ring lytic transglycosylase RlpA family protein [Actinomycetota bacterium]|nr:septal ring lytic transglycosylase RlpA family protein [Actinomycetota bacterium]